MSTFFHPHQSTGGSAMSQTAATNGTGIGFIGGGNMAEAILKGMIAGGTAAESILVSEPLEPRRQQLASVYGVGTTADNSEIAHSCSTVIVAVKPQQAAALFGALKAEL